MKGLPSQDDFVAEVDKLIAEIKTKEEERVSYMTFEMKMQDAHESGRAEGHAEGLESGRIETARDMLRDGEPIEKIIKYSHLSEKRIKELAQQL